MSILYFQYLSIILYFLFIFSPFLTKTLKILESEAKEPEEYSFKTEQGACEFFFRDYFML